MDHLLSCSCGEVVLKSANGTTKIRNKIIVFRGDEAIAICKGCNAEHKIPVCLDRVKLIKSLTHRPRLYVRGK
jgi:hypothetical protein